MILFQFFFLSCRRRHTRWPRDWSSDVCSSDLSGLAVGIVTALQFVPMLFLSPLAGLLADRLPRRKLLIFTQSSLGVLAARSEEHTSELQSRGHLVCRLLLEKKHEPVHHLGALI